jgi:fumarate hydratase class II
VIIGGQNVYTRRISSLRTLAASVYKIADDIRLCPAARAPVSQKMLNQETGDVRFVRF